MFESFALFVQKHKLLFDAAHALSSVVNLLGWLVGGIVVFSAWRRNAIRSVAVGPINIRMQEAAVEAAASAARDWQSKTKGKPVDVSKVRETVAKAFTPEVNDQLIGRAILWVDDNPSNNELAVRAMRKLGLDVDQVVSTETGMAALGRRSYDLIISDMGRGTNMTAGYELLALVRTNNNSAPFLIFAGSDTPEFRQEARKRGAQLSTNDMLELMDHVIQHLSKAA